MASLDALQREFARAALGPAALAPAAGPRAALYRRLVQATLDGALLSILPLTAARLGPRLFEDARAFYAARGPQTHYLRDVAGELLAFCLPRWRADPAVPRYVIDLARHELTELEVAAAPDEAPPAGELALGAPAVFAPASRVARYAYAVHQIDAASDPSTPPEERPVALLVYRDIEHDLRFLELSAAAAAILERMRRPGVTVQQAIVEGAAAAGAAVDDALLRGTSELLADLGERGVLLGGAPPDAGG